jgi:hypothetical protein
MTWLNRLPDSGSSLKYSDEERKIGAASLRIGWTVVGFGLGGVGIIAVWACGVAANDASAHFAAFLGADLLVAASAASAGALFGFIFGIPRTLDPASRAAVATAATQAGPTAASHAVMAANTNLERISDWLTTLLIGATLVQIKEIAAWIGALGNNLVTMGQAANAAVVPIIVIYYFALAFLGVYLITRLYLTSAFLQTIGMLAGVRPTELNLSELKERLLDAAKSGDAQALRDAMEAYKSWNFSEKDRDDPELNAHVARILAKQIASGATTVGESAIDLKTAIAKAGADPVIKARLRDEATTGRIKTMNEDLDKEVNAALN